ncbi:MAG: hypothetical protein K0V04_22300 [Deltaproteobacteria bacterium]|nr:hypothetical protein [Deltaproteobacteria bacterium]
MIGKFCVIGAALAGILAFFLPFFSITASALGGGEADYSISVMQLMQGAEGLKAVVAEQAPQANLVDTAQMGELTEALDKLKGILMIPFVPTVLFVLISLIGIKRFGRGLGVFSLIVGIIGVGGWLLLSAGISAAAEEDGKFAAAIGLTLLGVGAGLGTLGGILGIAKPQPKTA